MTRKLSVTEPPSTTTETIFSPDTLDKLIRLSEIMANSRVTVPSHLAGNASDCLAVAMQALQWQMNPFAVAQKTFTVSGVLGYEAQLVNAVITTMAPTRDRLHYEWFGPWEKVIGKFTEKTSGKGNKYAAPDWTLNDESGCGVRVWATMKNETEPRELELLLSQAQVRNSTLWASDPKQQLAYLAVKRWARLHCPDVILGVYTPDELETVRPVERNITPACSGNDLNALINHQTLSLPSGQEKNGAAPLPGPQQDAPTGQEDNARNNSRSESKRSAERTPKELLSDFTEASMNEAILAGLDKCYRYAALKLANHPDLLSKATDVFLVRKAELEEAQANNTL